MADDFKIIGGGVWRALRGPGGTIMVECEFLQCIGCLSLIRKDFISDKDSPCPVCKLEQGSEGTFSGEYQNCPTSSKQSSESGGKSHSTDNSGSSSRPPTDSLN